MDKIIYKTQPRLFILCVSFLGFALFGLLFLLTFQSVQDDYNLLEVIILVFFAILSLTSFFYLLTVKTVKLTKDTVIISHLLLPINRVLNLTEIRNMEQTKKEINAINGITWKQSYIYTDIITLINLTDSKPIKINSIGQIDFDKFYQTFNKLRQGEGKIKEQKRHFLLYLVDNFDGMLWIILLLIFTTGLGYYVSTKQ